MPKKYSSTARDRGADDRPGVRTECRPRPSQVNAYRVRTSEHQEFALREVDHPHDAEDEPEATHISP